MDKQKRPESYIGSGTSEIQIQDPAGDLTEGPSTSSPRSIDTASESISSDLNALEKPGTMLEGLGLLQSRLFDLRSLEAKLRIEASPKGNLLIVITWPGHALGFEDGHILADGTPVLSKEEG